MSDFQPTSPVVFTLPGKLGDNLARLPIAYRYARERGVKVDVCVDEHTAPSLLPLLQRLDWVGQAFPASGITSDGCGGQPWDFGAPQWFAERYAEVYHLGYRGFPRWENLTLASVPPNYPPFLCARGLEGWYGERPLGVRWAEVAWKAPMPGFCTPCPRLSIAPFSSRPHANEATAATIKAAWTHGLGARFGILSSPKEMAPLLDVAEEFARSVVITTYSAMCQLATLVGAPCVVLIPPQGYGLGHYDSRTRWYPGWEIATEGDAEGLVQAVDRAIEAALGRGQG